MKILVFSCIHGNEVFGLKILAHLSALGRNENIVTRIAHPDAVAEKKRFIEADLNRSFAVNPAFSLEARIAQRIKEEIGHINPDLIIDLHTSNVDVGLVAILSKKNPTLIDTAKHLGMSRIAVMPMEIAQQSLIGVHPDKSICVEIGKGLRSDGLAKKIATQISNLATEDMLVLESQIPLLLIERIIEKAEAIDLELKNYIFSKSLGGYPFLTGESNYSEHRGFLATSQIEV